MNLRQFLRSYINELQSQVFTTLPAVVIDTSKFESEQTVDVQPLINPKMSNGQVLECPPIYGVPVVLPSAGGGLLSFPIQVGNTVMCQFSMRNIESWLDGAGEPVDEPTSRYHDLSDAIAVVGLYTKQSHLSPNPTDVELRFKDNSIILRDDGTIDITTKSTITVNNDSEELISLLSELIQEISVITTNTVFGPSPVNNKPAFAALKSRLDTFKK